MPTSQKKIASNRRNAERSTGPKTYNGKNISKYNGMVHGLTARTAVIPTEDPAEYDRLMANVAGTLRPRNAVEVMLISQACQANWAHTRSVKAETARLAARIEAAPGRRARSDRRPLRSAVPRHPSPERHLRRDPLQPYRDAHVALRSGDQSRRAGQATQKDMFKRNRL